MLAKPDDDVAVSSTTVVDLDDHAGRIRSARADLGDGRDHLVDSADILAARRRRNSGLRE